MLICSHGKDSPQLLQRTPPGSPCGCGWCCNSRRWTVATSSAVHSLGPSTGPLPFLSGVQLPMGVLLARSADRPLHSRDAVQLRPFTAPHRFFRSPDELFDYWNAVATSTSSFLLPHIPMPLFECLLVARCDKPMRFRPKPELSFCSCGEMPVVVLHAKHFLHFFIAINVIFSPLLVKREDSSPRRQIVDAFHVALCLCVWSSGPGPCAVRGWPSELWGLQSLRTISIIFYCMVQAIDGSVSHRSIHFLS